MLRLGESGTWVVLFCLGVFLFWMYNLGCGSWLSPLRDGVFTKAPTIAVSWCLVVVSSAFEMGGLPLDSMLHVQLWVINASMVLALALLCDVADMPLDKADGIISFPIRFGKTAT